MGRIYAKSVKYLVVLIAEKLIVISAKMDSLPEDSLPKDSKNALFQVIVKLSIHTGVQNAKKATS